MFSGARASTGLRPEPDAGSQEQGNALRRVWRSEARGELPDFRGERIRVAILRIAVAVGERFVSCVHDRCSWLVTCASSVKAGCRHVGGMKERNDAGLEARRLCRRCERGELAAQGDGPRLGAAEVTADVGHGGAQAASGNVIGETVHVIT